MLFPAIKSSELVADVGRPLRRPLVFHIDVVCGKSRPILFFCPNSFSPDLLYRSRSFANNYGCREVRSEVGMPQGLSISLDDAEMRGFQPGCVLGLKPLLSPFWACFWWLLLIVGADESGVPFVDIRFGRRRPKSLTRIPPIFDPFGSL